MNKYHAKTARRDPLGSSMTKAEAMKESKRLESVANKAGKEQIEDTTRTELRSHAAHLRRAAAKRGK